MMLLPPTAPVPGGSEIILAVVLLVTGLFFCRDRRRVFVGIFSALMVVYYFLPESLFDWPVLMSGESHLVALLLGGSVDGNLIHGDGFAVLMTGPCVGLRYYGVLVMGILALGLAEREGFWKFLSFSIVILTGANLLRMVILCSVMSNLQVFEALHNLGGVYMAMVGILCWLGGVVFPRLQLFNSFRSRYSSREWGLASAS